MKEEGATAVGRETRGGVGMRDGRGAQRWSERGLIYLGFHMGRVADLVG
jgi:hypothetical protein